MTYGITYKGRQLYREATEAQALAVWDRVIRHLPAERAILYRVTKGDRPALVYCDTKGRLTIREVPQ